MEQTKFTRFKRILTNKIVILLIVLFILCGICFIKCNATNDAKSVQTEYVSYNNNITKIDTIRITDSIKNELINEVETYIGKYTKGSHKFIPKYLVQAGLTNNIDICFMMAQTQIETCYGTMGAGREKSRRSMFGVIKRKYPNYEEAINHYCEVLKKHYLVRGRTEQHLMTKYVTSRGGRYAGNPRYEIELKTAYNHIKKTTNIYNLQQEYRNIQDKNI